jgi:hypothetical protein
MFVLFRRARASVIWVGIRRHGYYYSLPFSYFIFMTTRFTQALLLVLLWTLPASIRAQVANGDFETRSQPPQGPANIYGPGARYDDLPEWQGIPPQTSLNSAGGDYLASPAADAQVNPLGNPYGGPFTPHGGTGCVAIRRSPSTTGADQGMYEVARVVPGHTYQVDFYVLRRPTSHYAEKLVMLFSIFPPTWTTSGGVKTIAPSPYATITTPPISDYQNWTHVTGTFVAQGNYTYDPNRTIVTITYDRSLATYDPNVYALSNGDDYYAIDDVSITDLTCLASAATAPGPISGYYSPGVGTLDVSVDPAPDVISYNWYKDGQMSRGHGNNNTWRGPRDECGSPTVEVEAVFACGISPRTSRTFPGPTTGCNGPVLERTANITAYPNPAAESITIPAGAEGASLVNDKGRTIQKADASGKLDVQSLPEGLYNLQMMQNGKLINQRIQVKH